MSVMGRRSVKLHINKIVYVISDVYYVPGLKTNLLSIGQFQQKQVTVIFKMMYVRSFMMIRVCYSSLLCQRIECMLSQHQ
jgi:hypothetical protein